MQRATSEADAPWWKCLAAGIVALVCVGAAVSGAGAATAPLPVPPEALTGPASWPYPDHNPSNSRLATGSPITAKNLEQALTTAWKVTAGGGLPTSPIVVGRSVFVEDQLGEVFDIDLATGTTVWKSSPNGYSVGPEGVAVGWGKVFGVTPTSLFALDETTGRQLWSTPLTRTKTDGIDVQPQVVGHEVIASTVPVSVKGIYIGGDRGFIDAVDESTGKLRWAFDTVASPTLWGNPSVNSGGGSWYPPSFSPSSGLLYVGVRTRPLSSAPRSTRTGAAGPDATSTRTRPWHCGSAPAGWSGTTRRRPTTSSIGISCTPWWSGCRRRAGARPRPSSWGRARRVSSSG